jgi:hypothetical protein
MASGLHYSILWPQVRAYFQLSRIHDLPVEWLPDALAFVQGKIDGLQKALPPAASFAGDTDMQRRLLEDIETATRIVNRLRQDAQLYLPLAEALKASALAEQAGR